MASASLSPFMPRRQARAATAWSLTLAIAMHCLLGAFLYLGVRWQSRPPAPVEAELWSEPPRPAARPASPVAVPEPAKPLAREEPKAEPLPAKPDIAVKEDRRDLKKPEPKKQEQPKVEPKAEPKKADATKPVDDPIEQALRKEELKRQIARDLQRDEISQKAASDAAALGQKAAREWNERIAAKVRSRVPFPIANAVAGNPEVVFDVSLLPGLEVGSVRLIKSSGNAAYDEAVERAIKAASPFPRPERDGVAIPRNLNLKTRPKDD